jgi:flagellar protein FliO/FliZ
MPMRDIIILQSQQGAKIIDELNNATNEAAPESFSTTDNVLQLLGLCLVLIVILIAAYYTSKFVGRYKLGQLHNSNIQVIEIYRISNNKMLQIVKIANKYIVLGVNKDQITYITELDEGEVLTHEVKEGEKQSFRQIFEKLKGNKE